MHDFYLRAWQRLRHDRQYGAMGGETPISFMAMNAYAERYRISGEAFDRFLIFLDAIDTEWLAYVARKAEERRQSDNG